VGGRSRDARGRQSYSVVRHGRRFANLEGEPPLRDPPTTHPPPNFRQKRNDHRRDDSKRGGPWATVKRFLEALASGTACCGPSRKIAVMARRAVYVPLTIRGMPAIGAQASVKGGSATAGK